MNNHFEINVVLVGGGGSSKVGKTHILRKLPWSVIIVHTVRVQLYIQELHANDKLIENPMLVLFVYDVTDQNSFDQLHQWTDLLIPSLKKGCEVVLVGNKIDLYKFRMVHWEKAASFARLHDMKYVETGAYLGKIIEELFFESTENILRKLFKSQLNWQHFRLDELTISGYKQLKTKFQNPTKKPKPQRPSSKRLSFPFANKNNDKKKKREDMSIQLIELLLQHINSNLADIEKIAPLHMICEKGNTRLLQLFFAKGRDLDVNILDQNSQTPLHFASTNGHVEIVEMLLNHGAKIDILDCDQRTPLFYAIMNHHFFVLKAMLSCGQKLDLNYQDRFGKTMLHHAVICEDMRVVKMLLEKRVSLDIKDNNNKLPIFHAIQRNNTEIAKMLINNENINTQDSEGKTLLHKAVLRHNEELAKYLVQSGASVEIQDKFGRLASYYAKKLGIQVPKGMECKTM